MAGSLNGFGTTFYGERDFRADGSYVTTEWVILGYLPAIPLCSHRLIRNEGADKNLVVYNSRSYLMLERLPRDMRQVFCTYGYFLLHAAWLALTVRLFLFLGDLWKGHSTALMVIGIFFAAIPAILPFFLRHQAKSKVQVTEEAMRETLEALARSHRSAAGAQPPPLPATPPPLPEVFGDERYMPKG